MGRHETQESLDRIASLCAALADELGWAAHHDYSPAPLPPGSGARRKGWVARPTEDTAFSGRKEAVRQAVKIAERDVVKAENLLNKALGSLQRAFSPARPISRRTTSSQYRGEGLPASVLEPLYAAKSRRDERGDGFGS